METSVTSIVNCDVTDDRGPYVIHDPITPSGEIIIDGSERKSGKPRSSKEKVHSSINSPEHFAYIVVSGSVVLEVDYSAFYELSFTHVKR